MSDAFRVAALVLAAGRGERMGGPNKLLCPLDDRPLVAAAVDAVLEAGATPVLVVTGHDAERVRTGLAGRPLRFVHNERHAEGMGRSLAVGAAALSEPLDAVLVCLGDMPRVRAATIAALCEALRAAPDRSIAVPCRGGRRGHPVLFAAHHLPALRALSGDVGARSLLEAHPEQLLEVELADPGIHLDVDTPADLAAL